ncbi:MULTISPECIES: Uma2 family endonuclease [unclassified Microcoleus]|uniref:Uma2 family endonuclease n=1 Tax=unclassified Microcoleus TaxID=2642155 RepID=UPI001DEAE0E6|nr:MULTISPECIES: Uma2 family endonuclease [unclassified Microcoleus]MCC3507824.1 Uma2 family endonuclease [Microcoleus sp. PH2017_17_BER_D_A]MCC3582877.1 Uma2 family endonuclease [Microcoleus sp. PH2017_30_WIL_O_A]MCC3591632.1 Uma2 family endonuclease [Microcoleus sp. PH2017_28_MFU_U_A]
MVLQIPSSSKAPTVTWEALPADFILPDDPVENIQQPPLAASLTDALGAAGLIGLALIGSNFGLVATINQKTVVKAPDWFYVPQVHPVAEGTIRRSYTPNLEGAPISVVMEFLSNEDYGELSVRSTPPYGKLYFYEQILQVPTYVTYDPYEPKLEVRYLQNGSYVTQTADAQGRVRIPELDLWLGIWRGERLGQTMNWLRWWDSQGNLLLWSSEQAEQERLRAEQECQRAQQERLRAEQERLRAEVLAAKLRELGVDPDLLT